MQNLSRIGIQEMSTLTSDSIRATADLFFHDETQQLYDEDSVINSKFKKCLLSLSLLRSGSSDLGTSKPTSSIQPRLLQRAVLTPTLSHLIP
mmetsp:Transcript_7005/g.10361  ORF Transcript_7005/g.10361 Transcript_7005/m.10361 type:complete len:92 (+) Transcript_7005:273-548(+)